MSLLLTSFVLFCPKRLVPFLQPRVWEKRVAINFFPLVFSSMSLSVASLYTLYRLKPMLRECLSKNPLSMIVWTHIFI